jgi:hypothetical protein
MQQCHYEQLISGCIFNLLYAIYDGTDATRSAIRYINDFDAVHGKKTRPGVSKSSFKESPACNGGGMRGEVEIGGRVSARLDSTTGYG